MELLVFLPLIALKVSVMAGILWWVLRNSGGEEEDDGEGGLRVDVVVGPRPPWRRVPRRRSPHGPHSSPSRRPGHRSPARS